MHCRNTSTNQTYQAWRAVRGFTLIELMIVMAILSILAVTVLPNIFDAAERRELITTTNDVAGLLSTADVIWL